MISVDYDVILSQVFFVFLEFFFKRFLCILGPRESSMVRYLNLSYSLAETDASGWVQEFLEPTPAQKRILYKYKGTGPDMANTWPQRAGP